MIKVQVSIIIVSFNCKGFLMECIESIYSQVSNLNFQIVIVDNNSNEKIEEDLKRRFPSVIFHQCEENLGFGAANNIGASLSSGEYYFFLNPDTILLNNAPKILYDFLEQKDNSNIAVSGCRIYNQNMENQISYGRFPRLLQLPFEIYLFKYFPNYNQKISPEGYLNEDVNIIADYISGAGLFIRSQVYKELNGFDEIFFLFFEETDLCMRVKRKGYKVILNSSAKIIHHMGATMNVSFMKFQWFEESRYIFLRRYYSFIFIFLTKMFYLIRYLLLYIKHLDKDHIKRLTFILKV